MTDINEIPLTSTVPTGMNHGSVCRRVDRGAIGARQIDSRVKRGAGVERVRANAEAAGELDAGLDRFVGGDGDDAVLELVELLPAVASCLEGRAARRLQRTAYPARATDTSPRYTRP